MSTGCESEPGYVYGDWDTDESGLIDENEFRTTWNGLRYYDRWDIDADGTLTEEEWEQSIDEYYTDYDYGQYGYYKDWDLNDDGVIDEDEFAEGNYSIWDTNRDRNIQDTEYNEWYRNIQ